jgi:hypothetical protein
VRGEYSSAQNKGPQGCARSPFTVVLSENSIRRMRRASARYITFPEIAATSQIPFAIRLAKYTLESPKVSSPLARHAISDFSLVLSAIRENQLSLSVRLALVEFTNVAAAIGKR